MFARCATLALAAAALAAVASVSQGQVKGMVKLEGQAPEMKAIDLAGVKECASQHADPVMEETVVVGEGGGLQNVIVSVKTPEGQTLPGKAKAEPAVLDQVGCIYTPHVVALMTGQTLVVKNSDNFLHNVHSLAQENPPFNKAQPTKDEVGLKIDNLKAAEIFHMKCDVHPWMAAYVGVFDNPFFAISDEGGRFAIKAADLPDGEYTFVAWHEKLGTQEKKAKVEGGKATVDFTFKAEAALGPAPVTRDLMLAVADGSKKDGEKCGDCCETGISDAKKKVAEGNAPAKAPTTKPAKAPEKTAKAD